MLQSLKQQQEAGVQAQGISQHLQREKDDLQEKVLALQGSLENLQRERAEMERALTRLSKEKSTLRKTLEKVSSPVAYWRGNDFSLLALTLYTILV